MCVDVMKTSRFQLNKICNAGDYICKRLSVLENTTLKCRIDHVALCGRVDVLEETVDTFCADEAAFRARIDSKIAELKKEIGKVLKSNPSEDV